MEEGKGKLVLFLSPPLTVPGGSYVNDPEDQQSGIFCVPLSPLEKPGTRSDLSGVLPTQRMAFSEVGLLIPWTFGRWPELSPGCIMVQ